jgi:hypothetical protein
MQVHRKATGCIFFLFEQGTVPEGPSSMYSSVAAHLHVGPKEKENYNQVQTICNKDPKIDEGNAIWSSSSTTATARRSKVKHIAAGDRTTWGEAPGAYCTGAERPP